MSIEMQNPEDSPQKELPGNLFIVTADDISYHLQRNVNALQTINPNWYVKPVDNFNDLMSHAMAGHDFMQADLVLLDHDYTRNMDANWRIRNRGIGRDVHRNLIERGIDERDIHNFTFPNSLNFAAALRLQGYKYKIIVVSSTPPSTERVKSYREELGIERLIDATTTKGDSMDYFYYETWKDSTIGPYLSEERIKGGLDASLRELLLRIF